VKKKITVFTLYVTLILFIYYHLFFNNYRV